MTWLTFKNGVIDAQGAGVSAAGDPRDRRGICVGLGERQTLYSNELEAFDLLPLHFQAELGSLPNALHQLIERLSLRVAPRKLRNGGHVKAVSIPLYDHVEFFLHSKTPEQNCTSGPIGNGILRVCSSR